MIMDDEYDMRSSSASEYADNQADSNVRKLRSMTALHASPLFSRFAR
jgi:hypothetical protein